MERVGGGDEFRQNGEMLAKWFDAVWSRWKKCSVPSVYDIITPSRAALVEQTYLTI